MGDYRNGDANIKTGVKPLYSEEPGHERLDSRRQYERTDATTAFRNEAMQLLGLPSCARGEAVSEGPGSSVSGAGSWMNEKESTLADVLKGSKADNPSKRENPLDLAEKSKAAESDEEVDIKDSIPGKGESSDEELSTGLPQNGETSDEHISDCIPAQNGGEGAIDPATGSDANDQKQGRTGDSLPQLELVVPGTK